ncbi:hypothetical protein KGQ72_01595 [Patescibacteria group bacterium]|nr:hypothetical protein [Patescibacteria group bacterium]
MENLCLLWQTFFEGARWHATQFERTLSHHEETTMSEQFMLDVGQANELKLAFRRAGWTNEDVAKLIHKQSLLTDLRSVLRGYSSIVLDLTIDCDAQPRPFDQIVEHRAGGLWTFNPKLIRLYQSPIQKDERMSGYQIRKELSEMRPLNANVLDFLIENPQLIPKEWEEKGKVAFWGTVYRSTSSGHRGHGILIVRYLRWNCSGRKWEDGIEYVAEKPADWDTTWDSSYWLAILIQ